VAVHGRVVVQLVGERRPDEVAGSGSRSGGGMQAGGGEAGWSAEQAGICGMAPEVEQVVVVQAGWIAEEGGLGVLGLVGDGAGAGGCRAVVGGR
jgi:hypothetical protein